MFPFTQIKAYIYGAAGLALLSTMLFAWYEHKENAILNSKLVFANAELELAYKKEGAVVTVTKFIEGAQRTIYKDRIITETKVETVYKENPDAKAWADVLVPVGIVDILHNTDGDKGSSDIAPGKPDAANAVP